MKKVALLLAASLLFAGVASASSMWGNYKGNSIIRLTVDGADVKVSDVPAISYQGRTMVPLYLLKEAGITYTWDQKNQTVNVKKPVGEVETVKAFDAATAADNIMKLGGAGIGLSSEDGEVTVGAQYYEKKNFASDWNDMLKILAELRGFNGDLYGIFYLDEDGNEIGDVYIERETLDDYISGKITGAELLQSSELTGKLGQTALSPREIAKLKDRVGYIETYDESGNVVSTGSGFMLDGGIFVTNYHVIEGSEGMNIKIDGNTYRDLEWYLFKNEEVDLFGLALSTSYDDKGLATGTSPAKYFEIHDDVPQVGEKVYAIGSPLGLENTLTEGIISGIRNINGIDYIQHTAIIEPGSSGGVLLNEYGNVIGVNSWKAEGSDLYFAIPIKYVYKEIANLE